MFLINCILFLHHFKELCGTSKVFLTTKKLMFISWCFYYALVLNMVACSQAWYSNGCLFLSLCKIDWLDKLIKYLENWQNLMLSWEEATCHGQMYYTHTHTQLQCTLGFLLIVSLTQNPLKNYYMYTECDLFASCVTSFHCDGILTSV